MRDAASFADGGADGVARIRAPGGPMTDEPASIPDTSPRGVAANRTGVLATLFGLSAPVSAGTYAMWGFGLMVVKFAVEALLIRVVTGHWFSPADYLSPLFSQRQKVL